MFTFFDINSYLPYDMLLSCHTIVVNDYVDISCPDAPVPPHLSILRCEHCKEVYVKQSRHPSTIARAYYCCPYKSE
jgi:hypothetical protein